MGGLLADLRFGFRTLVRAPGFTVVALAALALGIGVNSAGFSVIYTILFRPLDFAAADRLVVFWDNAPQAGREYNEVAPGNIVALREARSFAGIGVWDFSGYTLTGAGQPEQLTGMVVDAELWPLLGVQPALGRNFLPSEDVPHAPAVALISHGLWQRRFGGDRNILGRSVILDGKPTTIVGVMPPDFFFAAPADVWTPLALGPAAWQVRTRHYLRVVGKLRPGVSLDDARAELATINTRLAHDHPDTNAGWQMSVQPIVEGLYQGPIRPTMMVLLAAVGFVLLIACANVANLLLARAGPRQREMAIRAALGAGRSRVLRQLLTESLLLALAGGAIALVLAAWALNGVSSLFPASILRYEPRLAELHIDGRVLGFTACLSVLTTLVFGALPAWRASRPGLAETLREREAGDVPRQGRLRLRGVLVVLEMALAIVLVTGAGLMVRSFLSQLRANPGYHPQGALVGLVRPARARYPGREALARFQERLLARVGRIPGVESVASIDALPLSGESPRAQLTFEGRPAPEGTGRPEASVRVISPSYPGVMGIPLLRGRGFTAADRVGAVPVSLVSRSFARQFFPGQEAIGQRFSLNGDTIPREIVGIVDDVQDWRLGSPSRAFVYLPYAQEPDRTIALVLRTSGEPDRLAGSLRQAIFELDPELPVSGVQLLQGVVDEALLSQRVNAVLVGSLGAIALLLAVVGVYGVMAYTVTRRRYEIAVRMAMGARAREVVQLVIRQGMEPVLIGLFLGLAGALALAQLASGLLYGVPPWDPVTFAVAAVAVVASALLATFIPARRAARLEPMIALRQQ